MQSVIFNALRSGERGRLCDYSNVKGLETTALMRGRASHAGARIYIYIYLLMYVVCHL